ncbi:MAG: ABC transporter permease [Burkholderiales bacterium]|nr:ABC transporter permease [Burkholderiales bacterium]
MIGFIVRRLLQALPVLFGVSLTVFLMIHLIPGDPAELIAGQNATADDVRNVRQALGLDRSLPEQYVSFVRQALVGDFGRSFRTGRSVAEEIGERYRNTLVLGGVALGFAVLVGIGSGVVSAVRRYSLSDNLALLVSILAVSTPTFFLGLLLMLVFSVWLGWLPLTGFDSWQHLVLPAITLGAASAAVISRIMRSSLLEVLDNQYVRTARAKGLRESVVIWRHAVRNAVLPVITVVGLQLGYLLGGAVVTETVFAWPGIGRLLVQSILARDFPVVQAAVLVVALTFIVINIVTDLVYGLLDPRVSVQ